MYSEVFDVVTKIKDAVLTDDQPGEAAGVEALRRIYDRETSAGRIDPFLTEAMADFTADPRASAALYELALTQCASFPDEPLHTKRIGLARMLIELGDEEDAAAQLDAARFEANRNRDRDGLDEIAEVRAAMRSNRSLERTRER
jgi:hypothetical protein